MQHVRVYVQNEGAGEEEAVQSVQHNQQSPSPALSHVLGSTAIITFHLIYCYQLLTCSLLKTLLIARIYFGDVPVPKVLDLVANVVECVDHLVQTLENRYSSLPMIFFWQFSG